jgi:serralysin
MSRTPTAFEQALLEYTNQARLNPVGEFDVALSVAADGIMNTQSDIASAVQYFGVDLDAFREQMAAFDPVAPLAWNGALATAALNHTELMIETDTQSHMLPGEAGLGDRITEAGYSGWSNVGENIYAYTKDPLFGHAGFIIDWGFDDADFQNSSLRSDWQSIGDGIQDAAGHRVAILSETYTDIGIGVLAETASDTSVGPYVLTQNFGAQHGNTPAMLLGVFIDDADGDDFYDIGEGRGGITVTATGSAGTFITTTWDAGGYQMELAAGDYTVVFSGDSIAGTASYEVSVGSEHVKLDSSVAELRVDVPPPDTSTLSVEEPSAVTSLVQEGTSGANVLSGSGLTSDRLVGLGGDDLLMGDGLMAAYFAEESAQVFRLYQATLSRDPDVIGHKNWTGEIALEGTSTLEVAQGFVASPEFGARYGSLDNSDFVELLYTNVLGRAADAGGLARWTGDLDSGVTRAQVVLGFSDSEEFINATSVSAQAFAQDAAPMSWSDDVFRLYQATLDRAPDLDGFMNWTARLGTGTSFEDVAAGFVGSPEFMATYVNLDDGEFMELLYANVLDRAADAGGLANWTSRLEDGMTRAQVVEGLSQSAEFRATTDATLTAWMRAQGNDDTLVGGEGDNVLAGGILSDTFVFGPVVGHATVFNLEAWDTLDISALDYVSDAAALKDFEQQGADIVFDNGAGTTVTLLNTDLAVLSDEMILI